MADNQKWTTRFPELSTAHVDYEDCISPEYHEKEMDAVFRRTWLNIARVEQLPKNGSYMTKELPGLDASILLVRGMDGKVRAFHNMCSHRGNKLVWTDDPNAEERGNCRALYCKYHGWRYSLEGELEFVLDEENFFGLDKKEFGLVPVHMDIWEGFIFINLDRAEKPRQTLREFLGRFGEDLEGYPFHKMSQGYEFSVECKSNWKIGFDTFQEIYHAPILHSELAVEMSEGGHTSHGILFDLDGHHSLMSCQGFPAELMNNTPAEEAFACGLFGPFKKFDLGEMPRGINKSKHPNWGVDLYEFWPTFGIHLYEGGFYTIYRCWPIAVDRMVWEGSLHFAPPKNARERATQEYYRMTWLEYAHQDANTQEATQSMLRKRIRNKFPLCDEEFQVRRLHEASRKEVAAYEEELAQKSEVA